MGVEGVERGQRGHPGDGEVLQVQPVPLMAVTVWVVLKNAATALSTSTLST